MEIAVYSSFNPLSVTLSATGEELQEAAVKGMRIAYLSMWLPETKSLIAKGELRIIPFKTPEYDALITALWAAPLNLSPQIQVVVDRLYAAFNTETYRTRY